jgi:hypothetical protein
MNFDYELKFGRGKLRIAGTLSELDTVELKRVLILALEKCHVLELDIDDVTVISLPCIRIIAQVYNIAKRSKKALVFATRYPREAMKLWISSMAKAV